MLKHTYTRKRIRSHGLEAECYEERNMKLRPLSDRVIVKQSEAEEKTKSGIILPDAAKEKPTKGKVIAVGPGKLDDNGKRCTR